jgi:hypothetical protein
MYAAFPRSDYYEDSVPSRGRQSTVDLPAAAPEGRRRGQPQDGSHVHHEPVSGLGAQLCPCSIATPTPQAFSVASRPTKKIPTEGVAAPSGMACTAIPARIPQVGAGAFD